MDSMSHLPLVADVDRSLLWLLTFFWTGIDFNMVFTHINALCLLHLLERCAGVVLFYNKNILFQSHPTEICLRPIIRLCHAHSGRSTAGRLPRAFPPTLTSVCGDAVHPDSQSQLDVSMAFSVISSSSAPPLALPNWSTRWYSLVKSETGAAGGEEGFFLCVCVCVCVCVCLRVSSD